MKIFLLLKQGMVVVIGGMLVDVFVNNKKPINFKKIFVYKFFDFLINWNINNNLSKLCSTKLD